MFEKFCYYWIMFYLPIGFPRQEYCSVLPFPSLGGLPDPGIESTSPVLQADSLMSESPGKSREIPSLY